MRNVQNITGMIFGGLFLLYSGAVFADEIEFDLNQDGWTERIVSEVSDGSESDDIPIGVSTLEILSGTSYERLVLFYGDSENDFGTPVVFNDISGDGIPDIIVPRPSHEEVIVIESYWEFDICNEVLSILEGLEIVSPHEEIFNFGFEVNTLYDIDGDDIQDIQIGGHYIGLDGEVHTRTYIYSGLHRVLRGWADPDLPTTECPKFAGDVSCNGEVTESDLDTVLVNYGAMTNDRTKGELNSDGIVDGHDVIEVINNLGTGAYAPMHDPHPECDENETMYRTFLGDAEWSCMTTVPYNRFYIVPMFDEAGLLVDMEGITPDSCGVIPCNIGSCYQDVHFCFHNSQMLYDAFVNVLESCGPWLLGSSIIVNCEGLGDNNQPGLTAVTCKGDVRKLLITLNTDELGDLGICQVLAHEFAHVSQFCNDGLFANFEEGFCEPYLIHINNDDQGLCRELRAYQLAGLNPNELCEQVCFSVRQGKKWYQCKMDMCRQCCVLGLTTCCNGYVWEGCGACVTLNMP